MAEPALASVEQYQTDAEAATALNVRLEATVTQLTTELASSNAALSEGKSDRHAAHQADVAALKMECKDATELLRATQAFKEEKIVEIVALRAEVSELRATKAKLDAAEALCSEAEGNAAAAVVAQVKAEKRLRDQVEEQRTIEVSSLPPLEFFFIHT
jgi:hypothetical protein